MTRFFDNLVAISEHLRFTDALDIFLVWVIIYRVLLLIKQTRAVHILSGIGILAVTYVISIWLELATINWLLEKFFDNLFVIVVILFQSEIRRTLAHLGRNPLISQMRGIEETHAVEEIMFATQELVQGGHGALIVIEKEIGLEDFVDMGTKLDSILSGRLIVSLFQSESPLHDGAVIIRGQNIYAAGCFLPLSNQTQVSESLGTRHRAALGISEETDCLVVVISEEDRSIRVSEGGRLSESLERSQLREKLYKVYQVGSSEKPAEEGLK